MKTIVNKLRFALLLGFVAASVTAWSQGVPNINKMSITTQMFLDDMAQSSTMLKAPQSGEWDRPYAAPESREDGVYIPSFVCVKDANTIGALEALGVEVQCQFKNGMLLTTAIPVDKLSEVAALEGVTRIEVSPLMRPATGISRQLTNVDDVLTLSSDAQSAGLTSAYDGTGVLIGVVDQGIQYSHKAFQDASGNTRVKGAYVYTGYGTGTDYSSSFPSYGNSGYDHGTHTSSIAGGSSVVVSGSTVTVTDDHSSATYGGMAPGADLFLCDISSLAGTYIANSWQKICNYADQQNMPVVVNNSFGSIFFAHDGSSNVSSIVSDYFGDNHPNHICIFASGNEAGNSYGTGYTGGFYATKSNANSSSPLGAIVRTNSYTTYKYNKTIVNAWTRSTDATGIGMNIYVLDASGNIVQTVNKTTSGSSTGTTANSVNVSTYFSGSLDVYFDYVSAGGKKQALLYSTGLTARSGYSDYVLAVEVYPIGGSSSAVDMWAGDYSFLTADLTTSGHIWTAGTDDMTIGDEAAHADVISVGAYVSQTVGSNYFGTTGDIFYQSSYATADANPAGTVHPWITAPGAALVAAYNTANNGSDCISKVVSDSYYTNSNSGYAYMAGTSMAAPVATGIVAQWLQAAQAVGKTSMTTSEVKDIMAQTAIKDSYVNGTNGSHFGNGKINALAGVQYILDNYTEVQESVDFGPSSATVAFGNVTVDGTRTMTFTVTNNTQSSITPVVSGISAPFSSDCYGNTALAPGETMTITVMFAPTTEGTYSQTMTITAGDYSQQWTITGTGADNGSGGNSGGSGDDTGNVTTDRTRSSNIVTVPVYKTEMEVYAPYTYADVLADTAIVLAPGVTNADTVQIDSKRPTAINGYNLYHNPGSADNAVGNANWAVDEHLVSFSIHDKVSSSYLPYDWQNNDFVQRPITLFPESGNVINDIWVTHVDNVTVTDQDTYYVPVVVADGKVTTNNTYGSPIEESPLGGVELVVSYSIGKNVEVDGQNYTWLTAGGTIVGYPPTLVEDGHHYEGYGYRVWRIVKVDGTPVDTVKMLDVVTTDDMVSFGSNQFPYNSSTGTYGTDENSFLVPEGADVEYIGRFYYVRTPDEVQVPTLRAAEEVLGLLESASGAIYYVVQATGSSTYTGVNDITAEKVVVDVQYVNPLGMTSSQPFEGVNIIVTRYSDGTTSTAKVLK